MANRVDDWVHFLPYLNQYAYINISYHVQPPIEMFLVQLVARLVYKLPFAQLVANVEREDVDAILELALRCCTGVGPSRMRPDADRAQRLLQHVVNHDAGTKLGVSRSQRAHAYALMAHIYFEERMPARIARVPLGEAQPVDIEAVFRGAVWADLAAQLGFVPYVVLSIAKSIEASGFRTAEGEEHPEGLTITRFAELKDMWRVYDEWMAERKGQAEERDAQRRAQPNIFICAATYCGVEPTPTLGLMRCGGQCRPEGKPAYCSKTCQTKVRGAFPRAFPSV